MTSRVWWYPWHFMLGTTTTLCQIKGLLPLAFCKCLSAEWSSLYFLLSILGKEPREGARGAGAGFSSHVVHVKQCLPTWNPVRICEEQHSGSPESEMALCHFYGLLDDLADLQIDPGQSSLWPCDWNSCES